MLSLALISYLLNHVGWAALYDSFTRLSVPLAGIVFVCLFALFLVGGLNVWLLLRSLQPINFLAFIRIFLQSFAIGLIAPGQLGDVSMTLMLQRKGVPLENSASAYLLDKSITLGWFLLVAGYGLYLITDNVLINRLLFFFILKWILLAFCYKLAFMSFEVAVDWKFVATIPVLSTLVGYIPISFAGIGTVELSAVYWFSIVGFKEQDVLSVYSLLRAMQYCIASLLMLLGFVTDRNTS
jgi:uncharacterized membrane protein YbhN (UPF0104 family)